MHEILRMTTKVDLSSIWALVSVESISPQLRHNLTHACTGSHGNQEPFSFTPYLFNLYRLWRSSFGEQGQLRLHE